MKKLSSKALLASIVFSVLLLFLASNAFAANGWEYNYQKWYGSSPRFDAKIRSGTDSDVYDAFATAMNDWYEADSRIRITGSSSSLNELYSVYDQYETDRGRMNPYPTNGSTIQRFTIWINTYYSAGTNSYRSTANHEFGHVLGLGHVDNYNVLMNTGRNHESIYLPTSSDIIGVLTIWGYMD
ncbi:MAG: M57 family metalloprotease [Bacillota bacterium]|nr:M57 family metalloprotease [Bacillota bacterium]